MTIFQHHSRFTNIFVLMMISLFIWLIYMATSYGIADIFAEQANYEMQQWATKKITLKTWASTQTTLQKSLQFDPQNPDLLEMMGEIYYWKAQKISPTLPDKIIALKYALDYFLQATKKKAHFSFDMGQYINDKKYVKTT